MNLNNKNSVPNNLILFIFVQIINTTYMGCFKFSCTDERMPNVNINEKRTILVWQFCCDRLQKYICCRFLENADS